MSDTPESLSGSPTTLRHIRAGIQRTIGLLIGPTGTGVVLWLGKRFPTAPDQEELVRILCLSIAISSWLISWILELKWQMQLRFRFGLYWDRDGNPRCPHCRNHLVNRAKRSGVCGPSQTDMLAVRDTMYCIPCDKYLYPYLAHLPPGIPRTFDEARRRL